MDQNNHKNNASDGVNNGENGPIIQEIEEESPHSNDNIRTGTGYDTDDEDFVDSYRTDSPLDLLDKKDIQNNDRIPLIPTDFTSITEAMQNFTAVFESRYGIQHAPFYDGPLQKALADAFDHPIIEERHPLAIYLHNDEAIAAHIFPKMVFCSKEVSDLLKCQFIVWAWDMSQEQNRNTFYEWMSLNNLNGISDSIRMVPQNKYPILFVLVKEKGIMQRSTIIYGQENSGNAIQKLMLSFDHYNEVRKEEQKEELQRMEREQCRREQAEEYERSLAADRAKQQELREQRQRAMEEEDRKQQAEQEKNQRLSALAKILPAEPAPTDAAAIAIRFRCPNGELKERRFGSAESIEMMIIYTETLGFDRNQYRLWTSDRPRREVGQMDSSKTFAEVGWPKREQITIEEVN